jgi:hypothetical protein
VAGIALEINNPLAFVLSYLATVGACLEKLENEAWQAMSRDAKQYWERARNRVQESQFGRSGYETWCSGSALSRLDEGIRSARAPSVRGLGADLLAHRLEDRLGPELPLISRPWWNISRAY